MVKVVGISWEAMAMVGMGIGVLEGVVFGTKT